MSKNYFSLSSENDSKTKDWSKTKSKEVNLKIKKTRANAPSHYEIFEKCLKIGVDKKWRRYFRDAAVGIFPVKFSFDGKVLKHKCGNKMESVRISSDPEKAAKIFMDFLGTTEGIYHRTDKKEKNPKDVKVTWSTTRKSICKEMVISMYISKKTKEMQLSKSERSNLEAVINRGIFIGCFNKNTIIFKKDRVYKFNGLEFNSSKREFYLDLSKVTPKRSGGYKSVKKKMTCDDKWFDFHNKMYEQLRKSPNIKKRTKK